MEIVDDDPGGICGADDCHRVAAATLRAAGDESTMCRSCLGDFVDRAVELEVFDAPGVPCGWVAHRWVVDEGDGIRLAKFDGKALKPGGTCDGVRSVDDLPDEREAVGMAAEWAGVDPEDVIVERGA